jgi:hypothetical protein
LTPPPKNISLNSNHSNHFVSWSLTFFRFLSTHVSALGPIASMTLSELGLVDKRFVFSFHSLPNIVIPKCVGTNGVSRNAAKVALSFAVTLEL